MTAVDRAEKHVDELHALLGSVRAAISELPSLRRPAAAVGSPGAWTGTVPDRLHREELTPLTEHLRRGLERAEQAVLDELSHAQRGLDRAQDLERHAAGDAP